MPGTLQYACQCCHHEMLAHAKGSIGSLGMALPASAPCAGVSLPWSQRFLGIGTAAPPQPWRPASAAPAHHCSAGPGGTWQGMSATRRCNTCAGPIGHLPACCQPTCACCTTACATTTVLACLAARRPVHKRSSNGAARWRVSRVTQAQRRADWNTQTHHGIAAQSWPPPEAAKEWERSS